MRFARVQDYYRRLRERPEHWPVRISRVAFSGIKGLGEGDIPLASGLTVLCGPNGVGKTTLLRAIWAVLDRDAASRYPMTSWKLNSGRADVDVTRPSGLITCSAVFSENTTSSEATHGSEIVHIDSASDVPRHQEYFGGFQNSEDIINGAGTRRLTEKELASVNYITRRDYREVIIYEVELADKVIPFFEVTYGSDKYDSRSMGSGELASFFLWWSVDRTERESIVLIEEPECFLSPASQAAFSDYLVSAAYDKTLCVIITTHSSQLITPLGPENVRYFRRDGGGIKLVTDKPPPILLETLGISLSVDTMLFVEDEAASVFARHWLEYYDPALARRVEISVRGSDGEVVKIMKELVGPYRSLRFVGLFDGDMRGGLPREIADRSECLPGNEPIEISFRKMVQQDPVKVAEITGWRDLPTILFGLEGQDHHDWYGKLCHHLGLTKSEMIAVLFRIWIRFAENETSARAAFESLIALLERQKQK